MAVRAYRERGLCGAVGVPRERERERERRVVGGGGVVPPSDVAVDQHQQSPVDTRTTQKPTNPLVGNDVVFDFIGILEAGYRGSPSIHDIGLDKICIIMDPAG
jgi:hypothetical protein